MYSVYYHYRKRTDYGAVCAKYYRNRSTFVETSEKGDIFGPQRIYIIIIIISYRLLVQKVDMLRCRPSNNICLLHSECKSERIIKNRSIFAS